MMRGRGWQVVLALLLLGVARPTAAQTIRPVSTETELVDAVANPTVPGASALDTLALQNSINLISPVALPIGTGPTFLVGDGLFLRGGFTGVSVLRKRGRGTLYLTSPFDSPFGIQSWEGTLDLASGGYQHIEAGGTVRAQGLARIADLQSAGAVLDAGSLVVVDSFSGSLKKSGDGLLVIYDRPSAEVDEIDVQQGVLTLFSGDHLRLTLSGGILRGFGLQVESPVTLNGVGGSIDTPTFVVLNGGVEGTGALVKTGSGVLLLNGPSTHSGGTVVSQGTLQGDTTSLIGNILDNDSLVFDQHTDGTFAGTIGGTGRVVKVGAGTLVMDGVQSHDGGTFVQEGVLQVRSDAALGSAAGQLTLNGGTLRAADSFDVLRHTLLGASGGTLDTQAFTISLNGVTGSGGLTKTGSGRLVLKGVSDYTGGTLVQSGTLVGSASTLQGLITNNADVIFDQSGDGSFNGSIVGEGTVRKTGLGRTSFASAQRYTGLTTVSAGRLDVAGLAGSVVVDAGAALGAAGAIDGSVVVNGTLLGSAAAWSVGSLAGAGALQLGGGRLTFGSDQSSTSFSGAVSGDGGLTKIGGGTFTLGGTNSFTGGTLVSGGALRIEADANLGDSTSALTLDGASLVTGAPMTLMRSVNIGGPGGTIDTNGFNVGVNALAGSGLLIKAGAGNLSIGAAGTVFAGALRIDRGMVSGAMAQLPSGIEDNATLNFTQAADGVYNGIISGTGTVLKNGEGALTFTQPQSYTGMTQVVAGHLRTAGLQGSVLVQVSAKLSGSGRIAGNVEVFGTLVSGAVAGVGRTVDAVTIDSTAAPLHIAGDLTLQPGSTFMTSLSPSGATYLDVGGSAAFNGGKLVVDGVRSSLGRAGTFALFKAAGGVSGRFGEVSADVPVDAFLSSRGTTVLLTLERTDIPFATLASTSAGTAAGGALDAARATASDDLHAVIGEIGALSDAETADALDQIGGSIYATASRQSLLEGQRAVRFVSDRLADRRAQRTSERAGSAGSAPVAAVAGGSSHVWFRSGADASTLTSAEAGSNATGTTVGWDYAINTTWTIGGFGGYEHGTLTTDDGRGRMDDRRYRGGGYLSIDAGRGIFVDAAASAASHEYDAGRQLSFVAMLDPSLGGGALFGGVMRSTQAQPHAWEASGFVDAGLARQLHAATLQPFAGLEWSRLTRDSFIETGARAVDLAVDEAQTASARATVGLRASGVIGGLGRWVSPRAEVRYAHELLDETGSMTAAFAAAPRARFTVESTELGRQTTLASAGVAAAVGRRLIVSADYRAVFESESHAHMISVGLSF